ncbi:uncharacterized protein I303_100473 [Kwoniella dejecticola CBS 10117]|uniref:Uncharacterized protein n=1 Tax=Kwoniella dejecticola CBS 10117 TaxID=1296121 RepID=A0AAJ8ME55_9TREE
MSSSSSLSDIEGTPPSISVDERGSNSSHTTHDEPPNGSVSLTNQPGPLDDDSDLTDLSDIEMADEHVKVKKEREASSCSVEEAPTKKRKASDKQYPDPDPESDYKAKPFKRKAKKAKKKSSDRKSADSGSSKSQNKSKKRKDDRKATGDHKKKTILAKEVHWKDIPDWGDRKDCPLLALPPDILDSCFGLTSGLTVRDYISLAGVSRYFRDQFTPEVFNSICWAKKVRHTFRGHWGLNVVQKPDNATAGIHIFSRSVEDWKVEKPKNRLKYGTPAHYIPSGSRERWSQAQYIVYKEEQAKWQAKERKRTIQDLKEKIRTQELEGKKDYEYVHLGGRSRTVLGTVSGRKNGEAAVEKDARGLPIVIKKQSTSEGNLDAGPVIDESILTTPELPQRTFKGRRRWKVPEPDTEDEYEISPHLFLKEGEIERFDHWPNRWRALAVNWINSQRINKTDAKWKYKVTDAELLSLSHLLTTNPMASRT